MALGGDGLVAQAVPLTWRERGWQGGDWKGEHHHLGSWCWELRGSCVLLASPHVVPLATKWEDWQVLETDATKEPTSSPPPHSWDCRDNGERRDSVHRGAWCQAAPGQRSGIKCWGTEELLCTRP